MRSRLFPRSFSSSPANPLSSSAPVTRWGSSGWESVQPDHSATDFMHLEKYGNYFRVPNPATVATKLVCTLGPSTSHKPMVDKLLRGGMSCVRLNSAHGNYDFFDQVIHTVRKSAQELNVICPIMFDTKGPEIRVGKVANDLIHLENEALCDVFFAPPHHHTTTTTPALLSTPAALSINYNQIGESCKEGDVVLLDNGRIALCVVSVLNSSSLKCRVITGGPLKSNKGLNLPGCVVHLPHVTPKDERDVAFAVSRHLEYIAHSFTRSKEGIEQVRNLPGVREAGIHIIAKIESQQGLDNFDEILEVSDGIMVARGDLGVEIPLERVCSRQKQIIRACNIKGKFVITATEMLDSMISNVRPTRAEASDVANAVYDGTDGVMLSGETAVGSFPLEAVQVMQRICKEAELDKWGTSLPTQIQDTTFTTEEAFARAVVDTANTTKAKLILVFCLSSPLNARFVSKNRPTVPVFALSTSPKVCAQVSLYRGVRAVLLPPHVERETWLKIALSVADQNKLIEVGSQVMLLLPGQGEGEGTMETMVVKLEHLMGQTTTTNSATASATGSLGFHGYTPGSSISGP